MQRQSLRTLVVLVIVMIGGARSAIAHEFWIQPSSYSVDANGLITVQTMHGERFAGDVVSRNESVIRRFELVQRDHDHLPVLGRHGGAQSFVRPGGNGACQIVFESEEIEHMLSASAFEAYLEEEKLDSIRAERRERGETDMQGREVYVRCAKTLINLGAATDVQSDTPVGLPLEIVVDDATTNETCGDLSAVVLFHGKPIEGLRVVAVSEADPEALIELVTDDAGRVQVSDISDGPWMFTALHMVRVDNRSDVQWKSYWASIALSVQQAGAKEVRALQPPATSAEAGEVDS